METCGFGFGFRRECRTERGPRLSGFVLMVIWSAVEMEMDEVIYEFYSKFGFAFGFSFAFETDV